MMIQITKIPLWKRLAVVAVYLPVAFFALKGVEKVFNPYSFSLYWYTRIYGPPPTPYKTEANAANSQPVKTTAKPASDE